MFCICIYNIHIVLCIYYLYILCKNICYFWCYNGLYLQIHVFHGSWWEHVVKNKRRPAISRFRIFGKISRTPPFPLTWLGLDIIIFVAISRLGDQNLDSLQRLYGIAFPNDKLLKARHGSDVLRGKRMMVCLKRMSCGPKKNSSWLLSIDVR